MTRYTIEGIYERPGYDGKLTGTIDIATDGTLQSTITDHSSPVKSKHIKGTLCDRLIHGNHIGTSLSFFKFLPNASETGVIYALTKPGRDFEGEYNGKWKELLHQAEIPQVEELQTVLARAFSRTPIRQGSAKLVVKRA